MKYRVVIFDVNDIEVFNKEYETAGVKMYADIHKFLNAEFHKMDDALKRFDYDDIADIVDDVQFSGRVNQHMPYGYDVIVYNEI